MSSRVLNKTNKENAPPRSKKADSDGDMALGSDDGYGTAPRKATKASTKVSKGDEEPSLRKVAELERKLRAMTAERDRIKVQRDSFSQQFESLSKNRTTDTEALFEKYKTKVAVAQKAQKDIIANQSALVEKQQGKILELEKALKEAASAPSAAGGVFEASAKADPKEIKALKDDLARAKSSIKSRDQRLLALEKEYKAEVEHARSLQASASTPAPAVSTTLEEAAKDAACLRLYEDITELNITNVKITENPKQGKETTFNCIQTHGERSINFKLKTFNQLDAEKVKAKDANPWVRSIRYHPEGLEMETDAAFVKRLGYFAEEFTAPREQIAVMFEDLKAILAGGGEE